MMPMSSGGVYGTPAQELAIRLLLISGAFCQIIFAVGSSFFVNFQVAGLPEPWGRPTEGLQYFLSEVELEEARTLQNRVISKPSPRPPAHVKHVARGLREDVADRDPSSRRF